MSFNESFECMDNRKKYMTKTFESKDSNYKINYDSIKTESEELIFKTEIESVENPFSYSRHPLNENGSILINTSAYNLIGHIKNEEPKASQKCNDMCVEFCQKRELIRHKNLSTHQKGETDLKCEMNFNNNTKTHKCYICNKTFNHEGNFNRHMRSHSSVRNYNCEFCYKIFTHRHNLIRHANIHTGIKNYKCNVCEKSFDQKGNLKKHINIHSDVMNYKCSICNKSFKNADQLNRHIKSHSSIKNLICDVCGKTFNDKVSKFCDKQLSYVDQDMYSGNE